MTGTILRGRVLTFVDEPQSADDQSSYRYYEDGAVFIADGKIVAVGDYHKANIAGATVIDHHPNLILPGLIDTHVHYPQMQVIGSYAGALLEWLNTYTFVEEQKFGDSIHAARIASRFVDELIRHGTTTAVTYCSVHKASAVAFFSATFSHLSLPGNCVVTSSSVIAHVPILLRPGPRNSRSSWQSASRRRPVEPASAGDAMTKMSPLVEGCPSVKIDLSGRSSG